MGTEFTPVTAAIGGALIGISFALVIFVTGRTAGISGMVGGVVERSPVIGVYSAFLIGLVLGGWLIGQLYPPSADFELFASRPWLIFGGLCVGFGSTVGCGCTSGHGVMGTGRLSKRSLIATATFFGVGIITATLFYGVWGLGNNG